MVRYHNFDIVFAEIPGETTLAFNITNCPNRCPGCHSPHLTADEARLLEMERLYGGRSFAYVGTCLYCPDGSCTRPAGKPCRHPDKVRPSLEACGFDIARTTSELFGIDLKWGSEGRIPEYLTLVCGFFHNADNFIWNE